jgi:hypothetical protein
MPASVDDVGEVTHYEPPREPLWAALAVGLLTLLEIGFVALFLRGLVFAGNEVALQKRMAFYLASALLCLAGILALYRKYFLPDVMIVKKRKKKYEDLQ